MLNFVESTLNALGYPGIAFLMFLENVFPPIPSELIMPLAGFTAASGELWWWGVVVAGTLGSLLGQLPLYYLGRFVSEKRLKGWADRYGKWLGLTSDDVAKADAWFGRHGPKAVLFCRLIPGVRSLISVPAGMSGMSVLPFLLYTLVGTAVWTALLAFLGRLLGQNYTAVERYLGPVSYVVLGVVALAAVFWVLRRRAQRTGSG